MGADKLILVLESPETRCRVLPGGVVKGKVVVVLAKETKVRGIYVKLKGEAEVSWEVLTTSQTAYGGTQVVMETVRGSETFLDTRVPLLGGAGPTLLLPPGEHVYDFEAPLPRGVPPTFDVGHGEVRYRVQAVLDKPWRLDQTVSIGFDVLADVDLNLKPVLRQPVREVREKTLCCLWCRSGPLTLVVHLPSRGFVPGQEVSFTVEVDNASDADVSSVVCALVQKVMYTAQCRQKKCKKKMRTTELGCVEVGRSVMMNPRLKLPMLLPPSGQHVSIIWVSYFLSVEAKVSGPHFNPTVEIPLIVGSIPLTDMAPLPCPPPMEAHRSDYGSMAETRPLLSATSDS